MEIQKLLFNQIKESLPEHLSLVDEISELLNISYDSAYRRIRGEKSLSIEELQLLSKRFNLSVDALFNIKSDNIVFKHMPIVPPEVGVKPWLRRILIDMKRIQSANVGEIIYAAKDPPIFHYFQFPEIGAFKMFFWEKTLFQFPQLADKKFTLQYLDDEIREVGEQILVSSLKIPTIEIWNEDTFNITFRQIENYWVSGLFEQKEDIHILCEKLHMWINHIKKQAEDAVLIQYRDIRRQRIQYGFCQLIGETKRFYGRSAAIYIVHPLYLSVPWICMAGFAKNNASTNYGKLSTFFQNAHKFTLDFRWRV